jgi:hypothetical protein
MRVLTEAPPLLPPHHHQPLRVTALMGEPIVYYGDGLHLDGPLSYGAYVEYVREHGDDLPPIGEEWAVDFDLPLSTWRCPPADGESPHPRMLAPDGTIWGWRCSAAQADWVAEGTHWLRKKPATDAMRRYTEAPSHNIGLGPMKAKNLPLPARLAFEVTWYAHGDLQEVSRLLANVRHIGKLCGHGMGRVLDWVVDEMGEDWSCRGLEGRLMRRMPAAFSSDAPGVLPLALRAPYHHRSRVALGVEVPLC